MKLTTKQRNSLPKSAFAIPSKAPASGSYPIDTANRARNALSRVSQFGDPEEKAEVRAKVHSKFPNIGKKKKNYKMATPGQTDEPDTPMEKKHPSMDMDDMMKRITSKMPKKMRSKKNG